MIQFYRFIIINNKISPYFVFNGIYIYNFIEKMINMRARISCYYDV